MMPHISKKDMDEGIRRKLFDQFFETFRSAGRSRISALITELFTSTEKLMLAKRLAVILLVDKGMPQHVIAEQLQVSTSTVVRISREIDKGKYRKIIDLSSAKKERIIETIIKLIFFSMPPRVGKGRWKHLDHLLG